MQKEEEKEEGKEDGKEDEDKESGAVQLLYSHHSKVSHLLQLGSCHCTVKNMLQSIPDVLKAKLTHSWLKEIQGKQAEETIIIQLPPPNGWRPISVHIGSMPSTSQLDPLTHKVVQMSSRSQDYVEYAVPLTCYSNSVTVTVYCLLCLL